MEQQKTLTLRIEANLLREFRYVCKYNGRSANSQLNVMIRRLVKEFKEETGEIELGDE